MNSRIDKRNRYRMEWAMGDEELKTRKAFEGLIRSVATSSINKRACPQNLFLFVGRKLL